MNKANNLQKKNLTDIRLQKKILYIHKNNVKF